MRFFRRYFDKNDDCELAGWVRMIKFWQVVAKIRSVTYFFSKQCLGRPTGHNMSIFGRQYEKEANIFFFRKNAKNQFL